MLGSDALQSGMLPLDRRDLCAGLFYSTALRTVVSDEIANQLVFPNKITVPLMDQTGLASLLFRQPKVSHQLSVN